MEKIRLSSSCRNLISPNSCLALYKHEVRGSPISNQSHRPTFPANYAHRRDWRSRGLRREHHGRRADGLMCSCLCPLMPSPISCTTESCDLSHRKSPDTCSRKLNFNATPLGLKMSVSECMCMCSGDGAVSIISNIVYIDSELQQYHSSETMLLLSFLV